MLITQQWLRNTKLVRIYEIDFNIWSSDDQNINVNNWVIGRPEVNFSYFRRASLST